MREARLLELDWIKKEQVYAYRSRAEAENKGIKPILLIWVDTNKGDKNTPFVRSRNCVRECKKGRNAVESLELEQLVLSHSTVGGFEIAVFSEGVPEDFSQGQAFQAGLISTFPERTLCRKHAVSSTWNYRMKIP